MAENGHEMAAFKLEVHEKAENDDLKEEDMPGTEGSQGKRHVPRAGWHEKEEPEYDEVTVESS